MTISDLEAVEAALTDSALSHVVEIVLSKRGEGLRAASHTGSVDFRVDPEGVHIDAVSGTDPIADTDPDRFVGHVDEIEGEHPDATTTSYPYAHDQIAQFFGSPQAPDLYVSRTASHHAGGNIGDHGNLGVVQARAPFIAAGPGVRAQGMIDGHARMVDVAPTVAALAGVARTQGVDRWGAPTDDLLLKRQDGTVLDELLDGSTAARVVVFLWDGLNANQLHAAIDEGDAPVAAGLLAQGVGLRSGLFASLPTLTLANHNTAATGVHPGHSGILHNTWYDRASRRVHDLLDVKQMIHSRDHLSPHVETLHEAIKRTFPDAWTGTTYEFCDRGADASSFADMAAGRRVPFPRRSDEFDRDDWFEQSEHYRFMSCVDECSVRMAVDHWTGTDHPTPRFGWYSFALTDEASHEAGPHHAEARAAIRDTDRRTGRVLQAIAEAGALADTAVLLIADHGMQTNDPANNGSYADALASTGIDHLDIGNGMIYLT
ncbi:MAG TPA: alkaline phosphatase family protein [Acidimicrobiales bacterium]|nr:alkaline phosphatase family protein [Acidimicrobiales bacterium]